jgi:hypothetical protein
MLRVISGKLPETALHHHIAVQDQFYSFTGEGVL